jgi:uncharacterized protein
MAERKTALITGASSGIGKELAKIHASLGGALVIVARREGLLKELKEEIVKEFPVEVTVIVMDLSAPGSARDLYDSCIRDGIEVDFLINNAGFGKVGLFYELPIETSIQMIQLNVSCLTELTRLFLPGMIERKYGKILNVASVVSFFPGPLQAVYFASKAYVLSFSEAVANEVKGTGVTVTTLCPGATNTGYASRAGFSAGKVKNFRASAYSVALYGYEALLKEKRLAIPGTMNKLMVFLTRLSPRWLMSAMSRRFMEK